MEGHGGPKWSDLPTTKTTQQYMDTWRWKTPRGQLGFPKTRDELREVKEFAECDVISGKSVGCGRSVWRKDFSSPGVMKSVTIGPESVLPAQRNVLNERGRLLPEGTQYRASIRLLLSTDKVFVLRPVTPWVCVFPVFPTNKKNEPQFVLQT
jgi:hypothetical protein